MVFTRPPVPGKTKTRLIPALGATGAARLHAWLINQTLDRVTALQGVDIELWSASLTEEPLLTSLAERYRVSLYPQHGDDLGARMGHAFETALRTAPWAILLGTDIPELKTGDIEQAIDKLHGGLDAVAGPALDGGYYLLGLRQVSPFLFQKIPWGTGQVWSMTRDRLDSLGWSWSTIAPRRDLDRPEDLQSFPMLREL